MTAGDDLDERLRALGFSADRDSDADFGDRLDELLREETERGVVSWWWISFADGRGFLGACIVSAFGMVDAVKQAHLLGINPGGQALGREVPPGVEVPDGAKKRLLSRDDIVTYFGEIEFKKVKPSEVVE